MSTRVKIEVDERTADVLQARAAELGVTVSELVAQLAQDAEPTALAEKEIAELDRRWSTIESSEPTISNERVVRWLQTWGTRQFRPWHDQ